MGESEKPRSIELKGDKWNDLVMVENEEKSGRRSMKRKIFYIATRLRRNYMNFNLITNMKHLNV